MFFYHCFTQTSRIFTLVVSAKKQEDEQLSHSLADKFKVEETTKQNNYNYAQT